MDNIADYIIKIADLAEAQFAVFRGKAINLVLAICAIVMALVLAAAGFVLILIGIYKGLALLMPAFLAAFIDAVLMFCVGGGLVLWAKKRAA